MAYLSRKHLTEHKDKPAAYSEEELEKAKREGPSAFVMYDIELSEQLSDLLVFPPAEQEQLVPCHQACNYSCCLGPWTVTMLCIGIETGIHSYA